MSRMRRLLAWLKLRERPISAGVALASLGVALLATFAALMQAALLLSQVETPYRTALYVRQLETGANYYGAAHEQWAAIIDLNDECSRLIRQGRGGADDLWTLSARLRTGSTNLHTHYTATITTFPDVLHPQALEIWTLNERLIENVLNEAADCGTFTDLYKAENARARAEEMNTKAGVLIRDMRLLLRVDSWSRQDLERERRRAAERAARLN
jgi:hypothetical protein